MIPLLPLFLLWPKPRMSDSLVCPNSSLPSQFCRQRTCMSAIIFPASFTAMPPLVSHRWPWRAGSTSFPASLRLVIRSLPFFLRFFLSLCIGTLDKWRPWAIPSYNRHLSKICILPVDLSKHISALLGDKPLQAWHAPLLGSHFYHQLPMASGLLEQCRSSSTGDCMLVNIVPFLSQGL